MHRFHTVAVPHEDITKKQLTMDVFAADLWNTFQGRGPEEYTDTDTFFKKTHMTKNLKALLDEIHSRLDGRGGDGFLHIETPFGGGKTHALIAMYHSAKKWGAKPVVIVGTAMSGDDTPWEMIEQQLDGKVDKLAGKLAPGREKLRDVLEKHGPVIILIDELLSYASTAAGVKIGGTTLASQINSFVQQLSEEVSSLSRVCVVASFPRSVMEVADKEVYDELLQKVRKVSGRKERKITPIDPSDIPDIIRSRLFSTPGDEIMKNAHGIITEFAKYCEREGILPPNKTAIQYGREFGRTYPFTPQVIDILYHNWGSFSTFQRTRGVLRLLSLVICSLRDSERPFITLADFNLEDSQIRRELLEHVGGQLDSVISKDITDQDSGARKVERDMGSNVIGLQLGTRCATSVFMQSFSSEGKKGATVNQIKRDVSRTDMHSAIVDGVMLNFKSRLSYIKGEDDRYLFSTVPNINRLKLDKMESITDEEVWESEKALLRSSMGDKKMNSWIWPDHKDVGDTAELKLVIMKDDNERLCREISEKKGTVSRVYRNAVLFLCPSGLERNQFTDTMKSLIALQKISRDTGLKAQQRGDVVNEIKKEQGSIEYVIRKYYRTLRVPDKDEGMLTIDLGVPTVGMIKDISEHVYDALIKNQQIHESIGPLALESMYLKNNDFFHTSVMHEAMLKTPGSRRPISKEVVRSGLVEGAKIGIFGIGKIADGSPECIHFGDMLAKVEFSEGEVIMKKHLCETDHSLPQAEALAGGIPGAPSEAKVEESQKMHSEIRFKMDVPEGRMNEIVGPLRIINQWFNTITIHIHARNGSITDDELKKVREAVEQVDVDSGL